MTEERLKVSQSRQIHFAVTKEASDWLVAKSLVEGLHFKMSINQTVIGGSAPLSIRISIKEQNHKQMMTSTRSH